MFVMFVVFVVVFLKLQIKKKEKETDKFEIIKKEIIKMEELVENLTIESENSPKSRPQTRSLSPSRSLSSTFDFENNPDPLYRQAMKKISDGCSRFSKERDGMLLTVCLLLL